MPERQLRHTLQSFTRAIAIRAASNSRNERIDVPYTACESAPAGAVRCGARCVHTYIIGS